MKTTFFLSTVSVDALPSLSPNRAGPVNARRRIDKRTLVAVFMVTRITSYQKVVCNLSVKSGVITGILTVRVIGAGGQPLQDDYFTLIIPFMIRQCPGKVHTKSYCPGWSGEVNSRASVSPGKTRPVAAMTSGISGT